MLSCFLQTSPLRGWLRQNPEMDATNADTRLCMALDARRFAHLARDDHGLARYRSTAWQLPSHISVTRVLLREAHEQGARTKINAMIAQGLAPWLLLLGACSMYPGEKVLT